MTNHGVLIARRRLDVDDYKSPDAFVTPPPPPEPLVGITVVTGTVTRGNAAQFTITRSRNLTPECSVGWELAHGSTVNADFSGATTGVAIFAANETSKLISLTTLNRPSAPSSASFSIDLIENASAEVDPTRATAGCTLNSSVIPVINPTLTEDVFTQFFGTTIDHPVLTNDLVGDGSTLTLDGTPTIDRGVASYAADKFRFEAPTAAAAAPAVSRVFDAVEVLRNSPGPGGGTPIPAYAWYRGPPTRSGILRSRVVPWVWPGAVPTHNRGDLLLLILPDTVTTSTDIGGSGLKGPVLVIGGKCRPAREGTQTLNGKVFNVAESLFNFIFTQDAISHWTHGRGTRPFAALYNVDIDCVNVDSLDIVRWGLGDQAQTNANNQPINDGRRADLYIEKCRVLNGPCYIDYGASQGHSDFCQALRGAGIVIAHDNWIEFQGGQMFFIGRTVEWGGFERTDPWEFGNNYIAQTALSFTPPPNATLNDIFSVFMTFEGANVSGHTPVETSDYDTGAYQPVDFLRRNYIRKKGNGLANAEVRPFINPQGGINGTHVNASTQLYQFKDTFPSGANRPQYTDNAGLGGVKVLKPGDALPTGLLDPAHVGLAVRVTTVDGLFAAMAGEGPTEGNYVEATDKLEKLHAQPVFWTDPAGVLHILTANINETDFVDSAGNSVLPSTKRGYHIFKHTPSQVATVAITSDRAKYATGVGLPDHEWPISLVVDQERNFLYGLLFPSGGLIRTNLLTNETTHLGRPTAFNKPYVYPARSMWMGRSGRVYFTCGQDGNNANTGGTYSATIFNKVWYWNHNSGAFVDTTWTLDNRALDQKAEIAAGAGKVVYLCDDAFNLYKYTLAADGTTETFAKVADIEEGAPSGTSLGPSYSMQVRPDQAHAYFISTNGYMIRYNFNNPTGRFTYYGQIQDKDSTWNDHFWYGGSCFDATGNMYLNAFHKTDDTKRAKVVAIHPPTFFAAFVAAPTGGGTTVGPAGPRQDGAIAGSWYWLVQAMLHGGTPHDAWSGCAVGPDGSIYFSAHDHQLNSAFYKVAGANANVAIGEYGARNASGGSGRAKVTINLVSNVVVPLAGVVDAYTITGDAAVDVSPLDNDRPGSGTVAELVISPTFTFDSAKISLSRVSSNREFRITRVAGVTGTTLIEYAPRLGTVDGTPTTITLTLEDAPAGGGGKSPSRMGYDFAYGAWANSDFGPGGFDGFEKWVNRGATKRLDSIRLMTARSRSQTWDSMKSAMPVSQWASRYNQGYWVHGSIRTAPDGFYNVWNTAKQTLLENETQTIVNAVAAGMPTGWQGQRFILDLRWEYNNASYPDSWDNFCRAGLTPADFKASWIACRDVWKAKFPQIKFAWNSLMGFAGHFKPGNTPRNGWQSFEYSTVFPGAGKVDYLGADMYSKIGDPVANPTAWLLGEMGSNLDNYFNNPLPGRYIAQPNTVAEWASLAKYYGIGLFCGEGGINRSVDGGPDWSGDCGKARMLTLKVFRKFGLEGRPAHYNEFHGNSSGHPQSGDHRWVTTTAAGVGTMINDSPNTFAAMRDCLQDYDDDAFDHS